MTGKVLDEFVGSITRACLAGADALQRQAGLCPRPQVHMLTPYAEPPYVGWVQTRPFDRGADAVAAVAALGLLPSVLRISRLVVVWEHADLCTAMQLRRRGGFPAALVVLDASPDGHVLHWHPFGMHVGPIGVAGVPTVIPEWGASVRHRDVSLPEPIKGLLSVWRSARDEHVDEVVSELEYAGFEIRWVVPA